ENQFARRPGYCEMKSGLTHMGVYASGGISSLDDLKALKALEAKGLKGAILGKSLYAGKINLPDALAIAK
ncbi:MAG TPA: HisA/HisF-related TIM barrel protein, partial [Elusimicrobiota bacterium]|nr:HisA/HisF-related TIM barrel protein [Elusimicrobiota bacterium]